MCKPESMLAIHSLRHYFHAAYSILRQAHILNSIGCSLNQSTTGSMKARFSISGRSSVASREPQAQAAPTSRRRGRRRGRRRRGQDTTACRLRARGQRHRGVHDAPRRSAIDLAEERLLSVMLAACMPSKRL